MGQLSSPSGLNLQNKSVADQQVQKALVRRQEELNLSFFTSVLACFLLEPRGSVSQATVALSASRPVSLKGFKGPLSFHPSNFMVESSYAQDRYDHVEKLRLNGANVAYQQISAWVKT